MWARAVILMVPETGKWRKSLVMRMKWKDCQALFMNAS